MRSAPSHPAWTAPMMGLLTALLVIVLGISVLSVEKL
jgi:hypothetical protein